MAGFGCRGRIRPFCPRLSIVDVTTPSAASSQDCPIKGGYKRDSFCIPSINGQYALHLHFPSTVVSGRVNIACVPRPSHRKLLPLYAVRRLTGGSPGRE